MICSIDSEIPMKKNYNISFKRNFAHIKHYIELNNTDLINASSQIVGDTRFDNIKYLAWDFSDITHISTDSTTAELLITINGRYSRYNSEIITVFITDNIKLRNTLNALLNQLKDTSTNALLFNSFAEFLVWSVTQNLYL